MNAEKILKLVGLVLLAGVVVIAIIQDRFTTQNYWQVNVVGRGEVKYTPDTAKINIGVQVNKVAKADQALSQLNQTMAKVIDAVAKSGIDKQYLQTQSYNLYPEYDYVDGTSVPAGYSASQQLTVTVKNLTSDEDLVGKIVAAATGAGANQINSINFELSNIEEIKQQARLLAIADAKAKAKEMASTAGIKIGKITSWWENWVQAPEAYMSYADGKGGMGGGAVTEASIPAGQNTMIIEMNLSYQVK